MKIYYRILSVNESDHTFTVRYWTDIISEIDMCGVFDSDGSPRLDDNGIPVRCRTDYNLCMFDNLNPTVEEIEQQIKLTCPISWFNLLEKTKTNPSGVSLSNVNPLIGITENFDVDPDIIIQSRRIPLSNTSNTSNTI